MSKKAKSEKVEAKKKDVPTSRSAFAMSNAGSGDSKPKSKRQSTTQPTMDSFLKPSGSTHANATLKPAGSTIIDSEPKSSTHSNVTLEPKSSTHSHVNLEPICSPPTQTNDIVLKLNSIAQPNSVVQPSVSKSSAVKRSFGVITINDSEDESSATSRLVEKKSKVERPLKSSIVGLTTMKIVEHPSTVNDVKMINGQVVEDRQIDSWKLIERSYHVAGKAWEEKHFDRIVIEHVGKKSRRTLYLDSNSVPGKATIRKRMNFLSTKDLEAIKAKSVSKTAQPNSIVQPVVSKSPAANHIEVVTINDSEDESPATSRSADESVVEHPLETSIVDSATMEIVGSSLNSPDDIVEMDVGDQVGDLAVMETFEHSLNSPIYSSVMDVESQFVDPPASSLPDNDVEHPLKPSSIADLAANSEAIDPLPANDVEMIDAEKVVDSTTGPLSPPATSSAMDVDGQVTDLPTSSEATDPSTDNDVEMNDDKIVEERQIVSLKFVKAVEHAKGQVWKKEHYDHIDAKYANGEAETFYLKTKGTSKRAKIREEMTFLSTSDLKAMKAKAIKKYIDFDSSDDENFDDPPVAEKIEIDDVVNEIEAQLEGVFIAENEPEEPEVEDDSGDQPAVEQEGTPVVEQEDESDIENEPQPEDDEFDFFIKADRERADEYLKKLGKKYKRRVEKKIGTPKLEGIRMIAPGHFLLGIDKETDLTLWSMTATKGERKDAIDRRRYRFRVDYHNHPSLDKDTYKERCSLYHNSDRHIGHLVSLANFATDLHRRSTCIHSNAWPMLPNLNCISLNVIEQFERLLSETCEETFVVTGPVFDKNKFVEGQLPIASHFFKAILVKIANDKWMSYSFCLPHEKVKAKEIANHVCSLEYIEQMTGIQKLFPNIDRSSIKQATEDDIKSHTLFTLSIYQTLARIRESYGVDLPEDCADRLEKAAVTLICCVCGTTNPGRSRYWTKTKEAVPRRICYNDYQKATKKQSTGETWGLKEAGIQKTIVWRKEKNKKDAEKAAADKICCVCGTTNSGRPGGYWYFTQEAVPRCICIKDYSKATGNDRNGNKTGWGLGDAGIQELIKWRKDLQKQ